MLMRLMPRAEQFELLGVDRLGRDLDRAGDSRQVGSHRPLDDVEHRLQLTEAQVGGRAAAHRETGEGHLSQGVTNPRRLTLQCAQIAGHQGFVRPCLREQVAIPAPHPTKRDMDIQEKRLPTLSSPEPAQRDRRVERAIGRLVRV